MHFSFLERRLAKKGYRKLRSAQAYEARSKSKKLLHDVSDVVLQLQAMTERVETTLAEELGHDD